MVSVTIATKNNNAITLSEYNSECLVLEGDYIMRVINYIIIHGNEKYTV